MTRCPSPRRTTLLGAVLLALAVGVTACGGDDDDADPAAEPSQSTSTSVAPSPSPTPSPTAEPLSAFEDKAPVKAAREFFVEVAKSVNAGDRSMAATRPHATAAGMENIAAVFDSDLDRKAIQPGPTPFTPVSVQVSGKTARLNVCMKNSGWSLDPETKQPWEKNRIDPIMLTLTRVGGQWKFDHGVKGTADCGGVKVTEVRF